MKVKITETVLRDAHQSLIATRMPLEDMIPVLEKLDQVGYDALEMWGGATFDSCLRFLNEDPWERLRFIRKHVKNTKLQMLLRGQNILGYRHYADEVVEEFVQRSVDNGIDIIRIFDALNDFDNIKAAMAATKKAGAHAQGTISYTTSPFHTKEIFVEMAKELRDMGADSICIKDMSGILLPYEGAELIKAIKAEVNLPLELHSHMTSGVADLMYLKGIEAGADIIDTALSPLAMGTSQPATESFVFSLKDGPYDTGLNEDILMELADYFRTKTSEYLEEGLLNPKVMSVDIRTLWYQVPGGMLSNLVSQLAESDRLHQLDEVMAEIPKVREDLGYPPLVTPTSQIVGTQSMFNVLTGERYKMVPEEVKAYMRGEYGRSPAPVNEELKKQILEGDVHVEEEVKSLEDYKKELGEYYTQPEDVLSYALFPQVALAFFEKREAAMLELDNDLLDRKNKVYPV